jgi:hypothetical protein
MGSLSLLHLSDGSTLNLEQGLQLVGKSQRLYDADNCLKRRYAATFQVYDCANRNACPAG